MHPIVHVSPFRCRMSPLHDRLEENITEEDCRAEIESFEKHGQLLPALGRRIPRERDCEIELIYGARRLFVARHLNKLLAVEVRDLSDREAIVAMDIENRQRKDLSPYERGLSYARWLRAGCFESQEEMARALNVSASQVSRLLKLARLPSVVVNAFSSGLDICETWGLELSEILDKPSRQSVIQTAREIASIDPRPPAREVYRQLITSSIAGRKVRSMSHDRVVSDENGVPLFRVREHRDSIALLLPMDKISAQSLKNIEAAVVEALSASADSKQAPMLRVVRGTLRREASIAGCNRATV